MLHLRNTQFSIY